MGRIAAIATKHGKDKLLAPIFRDALGWEIQLAEFDTDQLGTFSGEIERTLSPKEAALAKARKAIEISGHSIGIGSEGSIYPNPSLPLLSLNTEVIAVVDLEQNLELVVSHTSDQILAFKTNWHADLELEDLAGRAGFPGHSLIVRRGKEAIKGLMFVENIRAAIEHLGPGPDLVLESDFRAMHSASRRANIAACAEKLVARISSRCERCNAPGFGQVGYQYGVPCRDCGVTNSEIPAYQRLGCARCDHEELVKLELQEIGPEHCMVCNP